MQIRPYGNNDKSKVQYICLNCDGPCDLSEASVKFFLTTYCDYYIEKEPHNCFVAVNDRDEAIGYILCAEDFDTFYDIFLNEYISKFSDDEDEYIISAKESIQEHKIYRDLYPAHLHIDIMPECQRSGIGHKLMNTLISHLTQKKIPGVMLTVWTGNEKGMNFYKKYGFELLGTSKEEAIFGMKL